MAISARTKSLILGVPGFWIVLIPLRLFRTFHAALGPKLALSAKAALVSREVSNHSYHNTGVSVHRLSALLANVHDMPVDAGLAYYEEIHGNGELQRIYRDARAQEKLLRNLTDDELRFGRQLLYYCLARALKPRLVFEAGTAHGIGSLLILHALRLNESEGFPGRLLTVDLNPNAGKLIQHLPPEYRRLVSFKIGNSETLLAQAPAGIDLFFHDTMNIAAHESRHYQLLRDKLSARGVICTTWGAAGTLADFSRSNGRRYLEFTNEAQEHWCGDTLGISLPRAAVRPAESVIPGGELALSGDGRSNDAVAVRTQHG